MPHTDKTGWVVGTVLAKQGAALRDRPFIQFADQPPYSFGAMDASANRVANALSSLGVGHGDRVLVMVPNSVEFLQAWLGINRLGAVLVPINTGYKGAFLEHVINNSAAPVMVVAREYVPFVQAIETHIPRLQIVVVVDTAMADTALPAFSRLQVLPFQHLLQYPATPIHVAVTYRDIGAIM